MTHVFLTIVLALGALLRFYKNTAIALWHDEAFSALYLRYPWGEMMHRIGLDVHPPLYYLILRVWTYFTGTSLFSLRLLSVLFGVLTIWAGYMFARALWKDKRTALLAALLIALNPFQIQYALEARMYTLGTFLVLWSSYFLVKALDENANYKKYWLAYALTAAAGLYTHYYLIFSVTAQALYVLLYVLKSRNLKTLISSLGAYILAGILYLPWLPTFLTQIRRVQAVYWIPPLDRWSIPGTIWKMIFGGPGARHLILLITVSVAALLVIYFLKKVRGFGKWLIILSVAVPFAGAIILSSKTNLYLDRYFVFASLFFTVLAASVLHKRPVLIFLLVAATIFAFFKNWTNLNTNGKPGMAAAATFINQNARPQDQVYVGSSFIFFTFQYYNQTPIKPLLISSEPLENIPHFSGTALLAPSDLILDLVKVKKGETAWLLWTTGFSGQKPTVPRNWNQVREQKYPDTPGFKGDIFVTEYSVD